MEVSLVAFVTMFSIRNLTESVSTRFKMFLFMCDQHVVVVQVKGDVVYFSFFFFFSVMVFAGDSKGLL